MTAPDLLACPFCGEKPRVHHYRGCEITCPNADCPSEPTVWQWDEDEAIMAWNTRATPAATDAAALVQDMLRDGKLWRVAVNAASAVLNDGLPQQHWASPPKIRLAIDAALAALLTEKPHDRDTGGKDG